MDKNKNEQEENRRNLIFLNPFGGWGEVWMVQYDGTDMGSYYTVCTVNVSVI